MEKQLSPGSRVSDSSSLSSVFCLMLASWSKDAHAHILDYGASRELNLVGSSSVEGVFL